jgi:hypothetical protein
MDPHFSVLLGDTNIGNCGKKSNGLDKKLIEIVVPIAVVLVLLVVLAVVFHARYVESREKGEGKGKGIEARTRAGE